MIIRYCGLMKFSKWFALQLTPHEAHPVMRSQRCNERRIFLQTFLVISRTVEDISILCMNITPIVFKRSLDLIRRCTGSKNKSLGKYAFHLDKVMNRPGSVASPQSPVGLPCV